MWNWTSRSLLRAVDRLAGEAGAVGVRDTTITFDGVPPTEERLSANERDGADRAGDEQKLVAAVAELDPVSAAAVIEPDGTFKWTEGEAAVFRTEESSEGSGTGEYGELEGEHEDVYLTEIGGSFLVVAFAVGAEFDPIEADVRRLVEEADL